MSDDETTPKPRNIEALQRARIARYFHLWMRELGITVRQASRDLGIDPSTLKRRKRSSPQFRVLNPLGAYIERRAREALAAKIASASAA